MKLANVILIAGPIAGLLVGLLLSWSGQPQPICWTAGVTTLVATWWVFEPIPIPATSLIPFALFPLGGVLDRTQVAHAYGHRLILLLMGGAILSTAMEKSGAHRRLALGMVNLVGGASGKRIVFGFMIAAAVLSMWISNTSTTLMLLPVAMAVLEQTKERDKLAVPLLLGVAYGANVGGIGTPVGTPPNVIFMAQYEQVTGNAWSFVQWMMIGVPVVILMTPAISWWLTRGLKLKQEIAFPDPGAWRAEEKRVLMVFGLTALLWVTRSEPFGGWNGVIEGWLDWRADEVVGGKRKETLIGDSTVALLMSVVMFVVPNGKGGRLLDWETAVKIPWGLLLLFGSGLAVGAAFKQSGLSTLIGSQLEAVTAWSVVLMIAAICLALTFLTEIVSNTATTNLMMPILAAAAVGSDGKVPPELLMIPAAMSASCAFMLPIATGPNAVMFGASNGEITTRRMMQEGIVLNLIGAAVITMICYLLL